MLVSSCLLLLAICQRLIQASWDSESVDNGAGAAMNRCVTGLMLLLMGQLRRLDACCASSHWQSFGIGWGSNTAVVCSTCSYCICLVVQFITWYFVVSMSLALSCSRPFWQSQQDSAITLCVADFGVCGVSGCVWVIIWCVIISGLGPGMP
jgi:hypothetical protein